MGRYSISFFQKFLVSYQAAVKILCLVRKVIRTFHDHSIRVAKICMSRECRTETSLIEFKFYAWWLAGRISLRSSTDSGQWQAILYLGSYVHSGGFEHDSSLIRTSDFIALCLAYAGPRISCTPNRISKSSSSVEYISCDSHELSCGTGGVFLMETICCSKTKNLTSKLENRSRPIKMDKSAHIIGVMVTYGNNHQQFVDQIIGPGDNGFHDLYFYTHTIKGSSYSKKHFCVNISLCTQQVHVRGISVSFPLPLKKMQNMLDTLPKPSIC